MAEYIDREALLQEDVTDKVVQRWTERVREMYEPPVKLSMKNRYSTFESDAVAEIYKTILEYGIDVDKDELIKALAYDRNQYDAGYRDALDSIVRCRDCAYANDDGTICRYGVGRDTKPNGYCHNGEREDDNDG